MSKGKDNLGINNLTSTKHGDRLETRKLENKMFIVLDINDVIVLKKRAMTCNEYQN